MKTPSNIVRCRGMTAPRHIHIEGRGVAKIKETWEASMASCSPDSTTSRSLRPRRLACEISAAIRPTLLGLMVAKNVEHIQYSKIYIDVLIDSFAVPLNRHASGWMKWYLVFTHSTTLTADSLFCWSAPFAGESDPPGQGLCLTALDCASWLANSYRIFQVFRDHWEHLGCSFSPSLSPLYDPSGSVALRSLYAPPWCQALRIPSTKAMRKGHVMQHINHDIRYHNSI